MGLGPDFDQINYAFHVLGITPKGWDMSQSLILLTVLALKVKATPLPPVPPPPAAAPQPAPFPPPPGAPAAEFKLNWTEADQDETALPDCVVAMRRAAQQQSATQQTATDSPGHAPTLGAT